MSGVVGHLGTEALAERYRAARDPVERSHFQMIWLLACGHSVVDVATLTHFSARWIEKVLARYNAAGPAALGDQRRGNAGGTPLLDEAGQQVLRERLATPPDEGGLWTGPKVAAWMARRLGLEKVHPQRGWEALRRLGQSLQVPRPVHAGAAAPEEQEAFKKSWPRPSPTRPPRTQASRSRLGPSTSTGSG